MGFLNDFLSRTRPSSTTDEFEGLLDAVCDAAYVFIENDFDVVASIIDDAMSHYDGKAEFLRQSGFHVEHNQVVIEAKYICGSGLSGMDKASLKIWILVGDSMEYSASGSDGILWDVYKSFEKRTGHPMFSTFVNSVERYMVDHKVDLTSELDRVEAPMIFMDAVMFAIADYMGRCGYSVAIENLYDNATYLNVSW